MLGLTLLALLAVPRSQGEALAALPPALERFDGDWLVDPITRRAGVFRGEHPGEVVLDNGLIRRTFVLEPAFATVALDSLGDGRSLLRAVRQEATLTVDGVEYAIGGLRGQPNHAWLQRDWLADMTAGDSAFVLAESGAEATTAPFAWTRTREAPAARPWPAPGVAFVARFVPDPTRTGDAAVPSLEIELRYELYDGLPALQKQMVVRNQTDRVVRIDAFRLEQLAVVEVENLVEADRDWRLPDLDVFSDFAFGGMSHRDSNRVAHWVEDPEYLTQVNYQRKMPCVLEVRPPRGPGVDLPPGGEWRSFRSILLVHDSTERERKGLAVRRVFRTLAPWCVENPLMMHVLPASDEVVRRAIDQCVAVGFEMVILSFGSGFDIENEDPAHLARMTALAAYAHERGIQIGGYSLFSSRRISDADDVIDPATGRPGGAKFGNAPCACSAWGLAYFARLRRFFMATGFDLLEHDGPYPGDVCGSTSHPGHRDAADSQWRQWQASADFYAWCRERGIYVNAPDFYFLAGTNKIGMGYRETNWSLPRAQQLVHARQNVFDGTWDKTPSMGWMFVPLTEYHGGGAAATLEPLDQHRDEYRSHLRAVLGAGVQACWRGPRLFDTDASRVLVADHVGWFKAHRAILESDVIHLRRADGRDWDGLLHVDPSGEERAMLVVHNPLETAIKRTIRLPLRWAGLAGSARIALDGEPERELALDGRGDARVELTIAARDWRWAVVR
ncbi:MAG: alpha-galactosidase [Planctomycetes bacterium]|nr:alpha-galactosidase [Planctomycetota bacterium]